MSANPKVHRRLEGLADLSQQPAVPPAPELIKRSVRKRKRGTIIENFKRSQIGVCVAGHAGLCEVCLLRASPKVGSLPTEHEAEQRGNPHRPHPRPCQTK